MLKCGERAWNLKRLINARVGRTRANDKLPKALLEPYNEGGSASFVIDLESMLSAYYDARGWDQETGMPTKEKLVELGLGELEGCVMSLFAIIPSASDSTWQGA